MSNRLENKVALVTGGGTGIGAATARRFAQEGASVIVCGRREEPLQQVVEAIEADQGSALALPLDVSDSAAFEQAVQVVQEKYGRLDILINNAYSMMAGTVKDMSAEDWQSCFQVTMNGTFFGTQAVMPLMEQQKSGVIVNVSSVCGLLGAPYTAAYGAAKAAVISFTRTAALEGAEHNIRSNVVIPGVVMTPSTEAALPGEQAQRAAAAGVPLRRIADSLEVANAILFLASDEASYITGTSLVVDGGKTCELSSAANMEDFDAT
ncbi:MAG: SDR family NAD(P)-dependent oxidoreductase [Pseudomonadales bacterium]